MTRILATLLLALTVAGPLFSQRWTPPAAWTVLPLGEFTPHALNDAGTVVGTRTTPAGPVPVLWHRNRLTELPTLSRGLGEALAISEGGLVAGWSGTATDAPFPPRGQDGAVLWENGAVRMLGFPGGGAAAALAVNDRGLAAGWGWSAGPRDAPLLFPLDGGWDWLPLPAQFVARVTAINAAGRMVGWAGEMNAPLPWTWQGTEGGPLPLPGTATGGEAWAINTAGTAAGHVRYPGVPLTRAVRWLNGRVERLPVNGPGVGINDAGEIVGNGPAGPWLWRPNGDVIDLQEIVGPWSGWRLESVSDVNNRGEIAAWGTWHGRAQAALLVPPSVRLSGIQGR